MITKFVNQLVKSVIRSKEGEFDNYLDCKWSEVILGKLVENIEKYSKIEIFHETLENCKNNFERVQLLQKFFEWVEVEPDILKCLRKNSETSTQLREKGNDFYKDKKLDWALGLYNLAIVFAEKKSEELCLAFANRSAVHLALEKYTEALVDIDLSLKLDKYPEKSRGKLIERKKKCLNSIPNNGKSSASEVKTETTECHKRSEEFCKEILFNIKKPHKDLPGSSNCIEIQMDEKKGRKLVVNESIRAGSILVVEEPFVKVLMGELKWDFSHCHHCFAKIESLAGFPCSGCVFAIYCDENCMNKGTDEQSYHYKYECASNPYLHLAQIPRYTQLAFRIIAKMGPNYFYNLFQNWSNFQQLQSQAITNPVYFKEPYIPILNLYSFTESLNSLKMYTSTIQAIQLTTILSKTTSFFKKFEKIPQFQSFISSLLLHHLFSIPFNSYSIDEFNFGVNSNGLFCLTRDSIQKSKRVQIGAGVFPVLSLLNHSCSPNVTRIVDKKNGRMSIISLKSLKKGDELLTNYTVNFLNEELDKRQEYLMANYSFTCSCVPCIEKWPFLETLLDEERMILRFHCSKCWKKLPGFADESSEISSKIALNRKGKCPACKKLYSPQELTNQLHEVYRNNFYLAYDLVLENKSVESINYILESLNFFQLNLISPFSKIYMGQDMFKQALDLIVYNS